MHIIDYIPIGRSNAVTRAQLSAVTGLPDRTIRDMIHQARRDHAILNLQDGSGYFRPDMEDETEKTLCGVYVSQEESRLKSIGWSLKGARKEMRKAGGR